MYKNEAESKDGGSKKWAQLLAADFVLSFYK